MKPVLSILDPSPIFKGRTTADALNETRALAAAADTMSYRAYWVQEHHNASSFAGTTPEILMADLAAVFAGGMAAGIYPTNSGEACR